MATVDDKVFFRNLFFNGGATHDPRLDELHSLRLGGEGDASAKDLAADILYRAGMGDHRLYEDLWGPMAEAILKAAGDSIAHWLNPLHDDPKRALVQNPDVDSPPDDRGRGTVNNLPSDEQILKDGGHDEDEISKILGKME